MRFWREACALRMLEAEKRRSEPKRSASLARIVFARYEPRKNGRLSKHSAAGNLAGNTDTLASLS